jgi:hypothetical protein
MAAIFTNHCRSELAKIRAVYTRQEITKLFRAINAIERDPMLPGSGLSYHDPEDLNARMYRIPPFIIFYSPKSQGVIEFTNVWHPRS